MRLDLPIRLYICLASFALTTVARATAEDSTHKLQFSRDIRPLLSDNCFLCHGPDESTRRADLRLDDRDAAIDFGAFSPENWSESEVLARISSTDPDLQMPPPDSGKTLNESEIAKLTKWISDGAEYEQHWAFLPPQRPTIPKLASSDAFNGWATPIDLFVRNRLERENLAASPSADKATLARRLYLDITGLPPTPAQIDDFLSSTSLNAYEELADRLLDSPHYGERWARWWLDAARYADSDGYEKDKQRDVWFYRDWVIHSLNSDMSYDKFIIHQIAGDLLPNAGQNEIVATGFLRNSMVNEEGGADPEQFRVEGMFDRVDAIGKSILGITTQCAQCHTHKYDPLTQHEYYQMFAALNDFHEAIMTVYTPQQNAQRAELKEKVAAIENELRSTHADWSDQMHQWCETTASQLPRWTTVTPTSVPFDGQKFRILDDGSVIGESYAPTYTTVVLPTSVTKEQVPTGQITALRLDALTHAQLPHNGPGRSIYGTGALTEFECSYAPVNDPAKKSKVKIIRAFSDVNPDQVPLPAVYREREPEKDERITGPIDFAIDGDSKTAWSTDCGPAFRNQNRHAIFIPETPIEVGDGITLEFSLAMNHGGWNSDDNQNYLLGRYRLSVTDAAEVESTAAVPSIVETVLQQEASDWKEEQMRLVFAYWRTQKSEFAEANAAIAELWKSHPEPASQLAVQQLEEPRETFVMLRGDFLQAGDRVKPATPAFLNSMPNDNEPNRLRFARWLVARDSPTAARVVVNRIWQSYFGQGIVTTPEDFGYQSPAPAHPEVLDWLAVELMENDWSLKHIHRLIVNSAVYQQSSHTTDSLLEKDPSNTLLARGPRFRVDAEVVRDIALSASGLLNDSLGGPSVYPPAPSFLFEPPASYGPKIWAYRPDDSQYRRSLYVHTYRSVQHPPLQVFDAPKGDAACVRRERSNTPLQALVLLNEPQFMECARALATRTLREGGAEDESKLVYAHRLCTSRTPTTDEIEVLQKLLDQQRERISKGEIDLQGIVGVTTQVCYQLTGQPADEVAPWIVVARALLNLDETITK